MIIADIKKETLANGRFHFYALGDIHRDAITCNVDRLRRFVEHVAADPLAVCLGVGDWLEGRIPGMKHYDSDNVRPDFLLHMKEYANYGLDVVSAELQPLVDAKVPFLCLQGNHDDYLDQINFTKLLVQRLGGTALYLGGEAMIRLRTGTRKTYEHATIIHAYHGAGGGLRPGAKINRQQQNFEWLDGVDIDVSGHVHDGAVRVYPGIGIAEGSGAQLSQRDRALYRAPAFMERAVAGTNSYAGRKQYGSNDRGLQFLKVVPSEGRIYRAECEF